LGEIYKHMKASDLYAKQHFYFTEHPTTMQACDVKDSRPHGNCIKRRRVDPETGKRYTTYEIYAEELEKLLRVQEILKSYKELEPLVKQLKEIFRKI